MAILLQHPVVAHANQQVKDSVCVSTGDHQVCISKHDTEYVSSKAFTSSVLTAIPTCPNEGVATEASIAAAYKRWKTQTKTGCPDGHKNDGTRFGNYEKLLPTTSTYQEYGVRACDKATNNAYRAVISDQGVVYFTDDHYATFCEWKQQNRVEDAMHHEDDSAATFNLEVEHDSSFVLKSDTAFAAVTKCGAFNSKTQTSVNNAIARFKANKKEVCDTKQGTIDGHPNDNTKFGNREGLLPTGSYKEYGLLFCDKATSRGAWRAVISSGGTVYVTFDHYKSFCQV